MYKCRKQKSKVTSHYTYIYKHPMNWRHKQQQNSALNSLSERQTQTKQFAAV